MHSIHRNTNKNSPVNIYTSQKAIGDTFKSTERKEVNTPKIYFNSKGELRLFHMD